MANQADPHHRPDSNPASAGEVPAAVTLQRLAVRASVMSLANQVAKLGSHFVMLLVMALYLDEGDVGLFALAISVQALLVVLRDTGLANALIQKKDLDDSHLNSMFWFSLTASVVMGCGLALAAQPLARFFAQPKLAPILWVLALPVVIQGLGSVQEALLRKQVRFGKLLLADAGSTVVASLAGIIAITLGAGVWGLVLRVAVAPVLMTGMCWAFSVWRPRFIFSLTALRTLWSFGGYLFMASLVAYGMSRLDSPIITKLIGVGATGIFFMARNIALVPVQELVNGVARVMFPVFSASQHDPAILRSGYLTGTRCLATLLFPLIAAMIALSPEAIPVLLPAKWTPTIPLIQIIALHGLLQCTNNPAAQLLYARGRSGVQFAYAAVTGLLVITSFAAGTRWGVLGVAIAWTIVRFACAPVGLLLAAREVGMSVWTMLANLVRPAMAAAVAILAVRGACWVWGQAGHSLGYGLLGLEVVVLAVSYSGTCALLLPTTLRKIWDDVGAALPRGRSA